MQMKSGDQSDETSADETGLRKRFNLKLSQEMVTLKPAATVALAGHQSGSISRNSKTNNLHSF